MAKSKKTKEKKNKPWTIAEQSEYIKSIQNFTLFDDTFLTVTFEDIAACQHIIRVIMGNPTLEIVDSKPQFQINGIVTRGVRLDVLAQDSNKQLYNIEIQQSDSVDHPRRIRFYTSMVDSVFIKRGADYDALPRLVHIYISKNDIWGEKQTVYEVKKTLCGTEKAYDDGQRIIYVNAEYHDGSAIAELMSFFKSSNPDDFSQGDLSKRVHFLKSEQEGHKIMCEIMKKICDDAIDEMRLTVFKNSLMKGLSLHDAADIAEISHEDIPKYQARLENEDENTGEKD